MKIILSVFLVFAILLALAIFGSEIYYNMTEVGIPPWPQIYSDIKDANVPCDCQCSGE